MKTIIILSLFSLGLMGCSSQLEDYVKGGPNRVIDLPSTSTTSNPVGIKVSPGANMASGSAVQSRFAITPTQRTVQGTQVKSRFSFHQNRPE